jgi:hypothetical protein
MIEYELQKIHAAELVRQADTYRLVRQLRQVRREARRAAKGAGEGRLNALRDRFDRAA